MESMLSVHRHDHIVIKAPELGAPQVAQRLIVNSYQNISQDPVTLQFLEREEKTTRLSSQYVYDIACQSLGRRRKCRLCFRLRRGTGATSSAAEPLSFGSELGAATGAVPVFEIDATSVTMDRLTYIK